MLRRTDPRNGLPPSRIVDFFKLARRQRREELVCNRFNFKTNLSEVSRQLAAQLAFDFEVDAEVTPGRNAVGLVLDRDGHRQLRPVRFGFVPAGKHPDARRALTNARIEKHGSWPWKTAFPKHRCVVPMISFREPCYWGDSAGKEVQFFDAGGETMFAAAIYSIYTKANQSFDVTMALLMRPGYEYVRRHGHHRSPFLLNESGLDAWMNRSARQPNDMLKVLAQHAATPDFDATVVRDMKDGWQKRVGTKQQDEEAAIERDGPLGFRLASTSGP